MAEQKKLSLKDLVKDVGAGVVKGVEATYNAIPEVGYGHLAAMARLGMAELRQAASFGAGSVEQPTPPGIFGLPTQGEIAQARGGPGAGPHQEGKMSLDDLRGYAQDRAQEAEKKMEKGQDKGMEM